jgi:SAM-dependent methyltransferase
MNPLKLIRYALAGWIPGGRRHCALCRHHVWRFMPYRDGARGMSPLLRELGMVGSDPEHFECPRCGAHDRERHLLLYLRATGVLEGLRGKSVLHFAPEKHLSRFVRSAQPGRYVACDLFPQAPDVQRVDMLEMPFADGSFDAVVANHVLEHVDDDLRALSEIHRVLAPGGIAILQTPYSSRLQRTWQDAGIDAPEARRQAYGQEDHVRLFGRDIFERFTSAGLVSEVARHEDVLGGVDADVEGVNAREPFFLFRKPA